MSFQNTANQLPDNSYELVLDLLRERLTAQSDRFNTLDSKANGIMTISTTLMGTALVLEAALVAISSSKIIALDLGLLQVPLLVMLIIYLLSMTSATFSGYWLRKFAYVPKPEELQNYALRPLVETQSDLVGTMVLAFNINESIIKVKTQLLHIAIVFLLCEILALGVLLFLQIHS
jgi:hypothetical protein